jgi:hypothetical protein
MAKIDLVTIQITVSYHLQGDGRDKSVALSASFAAEVALKLAEASPEGSEDRA